ncbi:hypothetical protein RJ639_014443 [Escallonia herrerae]|uniref:Uncharacterized protein n=1 Tax=Escallonia herrerae TaxID=1293975 RepID=A0AA89AMW8_9ASTE|nr:hypothetical protein RJ639_014443 [Escallonia herrerae]
MGAMLPYLSIVTATHRLCVDNIIVRFGNIIHAKVRGKLAEEASWKFPPPKSGPTSSPRMSDCSLCPSDSMSFCHMGQIAFDSERNGGGGGNGRRWQRGLRVFQLGKTGNALEISRLVSVMLRYFVLENVGEKPWEEGKLKAEPSTKAEAYHIYGRELYDGYVVSYLGMQMKLIAILGTLETTAFVPRMVSKVKWDKGIDCDSEKLTPFENFG